MASNDKLYRSKSDRVIAGVCGGLAQRFGVPAILLRILFFVFSQVGLPIYILMWIFVPANPTQQYGKTSTLAKVVLGIVLLYVAFMSYGILLSYVK